MGIVLEWCDGRMMRGDGRLCRGMTDIESNSKKVVSFLNY